MRRLAAAIGLALSTLRPADAHVSRAVTLSLMPASAVAPVLAARAGDALAFSEPSPFVTPVAASIAASWPSPIASAAAEPFLFAPSTLPTAAAVRASFDAPRWDSSDEERYQAALGLALFDGFTTRSGSLFVPSAKPHPAVRGVPLIRVRPAPPTRARSVQGTDKLSGKPLLDFLTAWVGDRHKPQSKKDSWRELFARVDRHTLNGITGVADAYDGVFIPGTGHSGRDYAMTGDLVGDGYAGFQTMNVEHVFPQSFFDGKFPMFSDLHSLMATFERPNTKRQNLPFGHVAGSRLEYSNDAGAKRGGGMFEPPNLTKGRVARAMLYFYVRYRREPFFTGEVARFWNSQIDVLLDWNRRYPPTIEEMKRNDYIEGFQGNRNPFVDNWKLADRIGRIVFKASSRRPYPPASIGGRVNRRRPSPSAPAPRPGRRRRSTPRWSPGR